MPRHWTSEEDALLRQMVDDGMTCQEMAKYLPRRTAAGVKTRVNKVWGERLGRKSLTNPHVMTAVMGAVVAGHHTYEAIARVVGRDKALVGRWVREFEAKGLLRVHRRGRLSRVVFAGGISREDDWRGRPLRLPPPVGNRGQKKA